MTPDKDFCRGVMSTGKSPNDQNEVVPRVACGLVWRIAPRSATWCKISTALTEMVVRTVAWLMIGLLVSVGN